MKTKILSPLRRDGYKAGMIMMLIALSTMLLTTACSSEDDFTNNTVNSQPVAKKGYALPVTVSATREGDKGSNRAAYDDGTKKLSFSEGDKLFVEGSHIDADRFAGTLDYDAVSGKFSGTIYTESEYTGTIDDLMASARATLLPAGYGSYGFFSVEESGSDAWVDVDRTKAFALTKAAAVEQFSVEQAVSYSSGFALAPQNAIASFTISGLTANKKVTVSFGTGLGIISGNVTTNATGVATFAVGVSEDWKLEECTLTVDGNDIAMPTKTVVPGHIYNITRSAGPTYTLLSAVTTADYGKVVCAAGHLHDAKTAVPAGCTAVGILGKVTATGHGLILALQDATQQSWYTIDSWASVTYAGTTLKQLPAGALGSLTSYTTLGSTTVSNWCVAQKSDYEAIFKNLGSAKYDEDGYTYDATVNAYITTNVGGTAISGTYWSATECDGWHGWYFLSNWWYAEGSMTQIFNLRPVLGF